MWLFTRYGFYSAACASTDGGAIDPDRMMIRARKRDHLDKLRTRFPEIADAEVIRTPDRDYRYRIVIAKQQWIGVITALAEEQTWSNLKSEAQRFQGKSGARYVHALHDVWGVMHRTQSSD